MCPCPSEKSVRTMLSVNFWNPVTCFAACCLIYLIGEFLSHLTKGYVPSLLFASFIFLFAFWAGVLPVDVTTSSGIVTVTANFGIALLLTNMGTMIDLETMCREWKTVLIAFLGLGGILVAAFAVGIPLFGREYALVAAPPIAGGTIAGILVQEAANAAGRPELAGFAVLVLAFQGFVGMPIATLGMKKELARKLKAGDFDSDALPSDRLKLPSMRIFKETPAKFKTSTMYLFKLGVVATLANIVGLMTKIPGDGPANYYLNPNIAYLLFGMLFTRLGFLEKESLQKSNAYGFCLMGLMFMLPGSLSSISPSDLLSMIVPLAGMLVFSAAGVCLIAAILGKLVGYSPYMSLSVAITCMFGYPGTELLTNEAVREMGDGVTDEQRARAKAYLLPKMVVGGFVTVTIASVAFASAIAPIIFQ